MVREFITSFDQFETFVMSEMAKQAQKGGSPKAFTPKLGRNLETSKSINSCKMVEPSNHLDAQKPWSIFDTPQLGTSSSLGTTPRRSSRIANKKRIDYKETDPLWLRKLRRRSQSVHSKLRNGKDRYSIKNLFKKPTKKRAGKKNKKNKSNKRTSLKKIENKGQPLKKSTTNAADSFTTAQTPPPVLTTPVTKGSLKLFEEIQNEIFDTFKKSYEPQTSLVMSEVFKEIEQLFESKKAEMSGKTRNSTKTVTNKSFSEVVKKVGASEHKNQPAVTITEAFKCLTIIEVPNEIHNIVEMEENDQDCFANADAENHKNKTQFDGFDRSIKTKVPEQQHNTETLQEMEEPSGITAMEVSNDNQNPAEMSSFEGQILNNDNDGIISEVTEHNFHSGQKIVTNKFAERKQSSDSTFSSENKNPAKIRPASVVEVTHKSFPGVAEISHDDNEIVDVDMTENSMQSEQITVNCEPPSNTVMEVSDKYQNPVEVCATRTVTGVVEKVFPVIINEHSEQHIVSNAFAEINKSDNKIQKSCYVRVERAIKIIQESSPTVAEIGNDVKDAVIADISNKNDQLQEQIVIKTSEETKKLSASTEMQVSEENIRNSAKIKPRNFVEIIEQKILRSEQKLLNEASVEREQPSDVTIMEIFDGNQNLAEFNLRSSNEIVKENFSDVGRNYYDNNDINITDISRKNMQKGQTLIATETDAFPEIKSSVDLTITEIPYTNPNPAETEDENDVEFVMEIFPNDAENCNVNSVTETPKETEQHEKNALTISFEENNQQNSDLAIVEISDQNDNLVEIKLGGVDKVGEVGISGVATICCDSDDEILNTSSKIRRRQKIIASEAFEERDQPPFDLTILEISDINQTPAKTEQDNDMEIDEETFSIDTDISNDSFVSETTKDNEQNEHNIIIKAFEDRDQPYFDLTKGEVTDKNLNLVEVKLRSVHAVVEKSRYDGAEILCDNNNDNIVDVSIKKQLHKEKIIATKEGKLSFDLTILEIPDINQTQPKTEEESAMEIDEVTYPSDTESFNDGFIFETPNDTEQDEHNIIIKSFGERDQQPFISDENEIASEIDEKGLDEAGDDSEVEVIDEGFLDDVGNYKKKPIDEEFVKCSAEVEMLYSQEYHRIYQKQHIEVIQKYNLSDQSSYYPHFDHRTEEKELGYAPTKFCSTVLSQIHHNPPKLQMQIEQNRRMQVHDHGSLELQSKLELSEYVPLPENTQHHKPQLQMSHCTPLVHPYNSLQHRNQYNLRGSTPSDSEFRHPPLPNGPPQWSQLYLQSQMQVGQVCENSCHIQVVSPSNSELKNDHWQIVSSKVPRPALGNREHDGYKQRHDYSCNIQVLPQKNRLPYQDDQRCHHKALVQYNTNQRIAQIAQMYQQSVQQSNYEQQPQSYQENLPENGPEPQPLLGITQGVKNNCHIHDVKFGRLDSLDGRIFRTGSMIIQFGDNLQVQVIGDLLLNSVYESLAFDAFFSPRQHF